MKTNFFSGRAVIGGLAVMAMTLAPALTGQNTAEAKHDNGKHKGWSKQDNWKNGKRKGSSKSHSDRRRDNDDDYRDRNWRDNRWDTNRWRTNRSTSSNWLRSNTRSDNWRRTSNWKRTNTRNNTWRRTNTTRNTTWRLADTDYYRSRDAARRAAATSRTRGYRTSTSYDPNSSRWIVREYLRR
jgi:hypothetical protein